MLALIAGRIGRIFQAAGQPDLQQTRLIYAFVPFDFFDEAGFKRQRYLASRWPSCNCAANPHAVGSHVIPDLARPVSSRSKCPILAEFLTRLISLATIASSE